MNASAAADAQTASAARTYAASVILDLSKKISSLDTMAV
ncbi:MAG: hypothetical protein ACI9KK_001873 [Ascidiaceihabitans sp.]|jgi:hypothetical protein